MRSRFLDVYVCIESPGVGVGAYSYARLPYVRAVPRRYFTLHFLDNSLLPPSRFNSSALISFRVDAFFSLSFFVFANLAPQLS